MLDRHGRSSQPTTPRQSPWDMASRWSDSLERPRAFGLSAVRGSEWATSVSIRAFTVSSPWDFKVEWLPVLIFSPSSLQAMVWHMHALVTRRLCAGILVAHMHPHSLFPSLTLCCLFDIPRSFPQSARVWLLLGLGRSRPLSSLYLPQDT